MSDSDQNRLKWTDERIDALQKLWLEGKTAAEIAKILGGVTRNAVIGKAHRLNLAGRTVPTTLMKDADPHKKPAVKAVEKSVKSAVAKKSTPKTVLKTAENFNDTPIPSKVETQAKREAKNRALLQERQDHLDMALEQVRAMPALKKISPANDDGDEASKIGQYKLIDLKDCMCRWPYGDPKTDQFSFCGDKIVSGTPYCSKHAAKAYQTISKNRALKMDENLYEKKGIA
jgi:GcrA cell cycle regulator